MAVRGRRVPGIAVVALTGGLLCLHVATLLRYPRPHVDEAWAANRAWALITTGMAFGGLDAGVFERYPGYWTYFPLIPTGLQAAPLLLAGGPTLWPLRALSLAFGAVLLGACFVIGRSVGGRTMGLVACALVGLSQTFLFSAHLARWDIMVAALGYTAIATLLTNRRRSWTWAAVSGLCLGLAFEIHPHSLVFVPAALALFVVESGSRALRRRDLWAWACGLVLGTCVYVLLHLARFPSTHIALLRLAHGPTHTPPLLTFDAGLLVQGGLEAARLAFLLNPFWFVCFAVAAIYLVASRSPIGELPLVLSAALLASLALLVRNKQGYYGILVTPAFDLTIAAFFTIVSGVRPTTSLGRLASITATVCLGVGFAFNALPLRSNGSREFESVVARVIRVVGPNDTVMGPQTYWLGLPDRRYYSWEQLVYYKRYAPGSSLEDGLKEFRPDIFILDGHLAQFVRDHAGSHLYTVHLNLPRAELMAFLARRAKLVADFDGSGYGRVRVYRIDWS